MGTQRRFQSNFSFSQWNQSKSQVFQPSVAWVAYRSAGPYRSAGLYRGAGLPARSPRIPRLAALD